MAKIVHSDTAPAEPVSYSFSGVEFRIDGKSKSYESNDPAVLANAESHPWLAVEYEEVEQIQGAYVDQLAPADDAMSSLNSVANDPEAARRAEDDKRAAFDRVALDADKEQTEVVTVDGPGDTEVAETLAAVEDSKTAKNARSKD